MLRASFLSQARHLVTLKIARCKDFLNAETCNSLSFTSSLAARTSRPLSRQTGHYFGGSGWFRPNDPLILNQMLLLAELRYHECGVGIAAKHAIRVARSACFCLGERLSRRSFSSCLARS